MAWNETGKFKFPAFSELPNELPVAVWQHAPRVRIGMLHVCVIFHDFCMLAIVQDRREDKLVILLARTSMRAGSKPIFPLPSNILTFTTRAGFFGSPGSPAEKLP